MCSSSFVFSRPSYPPPHLYPHSCLTVITSIPLPIFLLSSILLFLYSCSRCIPFFLPLYSILQSYPSFLLSCSTHSYSFPSFFPSFLPCFLTNLVSFQSFQLSVFLSKPLSLPLISSSFISSHQFILLSILPILILPFSVIVVLFPLFSLPFLTYHLPSSSSPKSTTFPSPTPSLLHLLHKSGLPSIHLYTRQILSFLSPSRPSSSLHHILPPFLSLNSRHLSSSLHPFLPASLPQSSLSSLHSPLNSYYAFSLFPFFPPSGNITPMVKQYLRRPG